VIVFEPIRNLSPGNLPGSRCSGAERPTPACGGHAPRSAEATLDELMALSSRAGAGVVLIPGGRETVHVLKTEL